MSDDGDGGEKEHEPSARRLEQARAKGDIVRSADLTSAAGYAGMALVAAGMGGTALMVVGQTGMTLLDQSDHLSRLVFSGAAAAPVGGMMGQIARATAPFFLAPALASLLMILAQRALVFSGEKLMPKWSRLSPLAAAKQKFGPDGLFEFGKSTAKLIIIATLLALFLRHRAGDIMGSLYLSPAMGTAILLRLMTEFLFIVVLITGTIAGADYLWQRNRHLHRNRMSRQEMIDEHKDQDGDPHTKAQRRQRAVDIATNRMLAEVPKADVIIVNPTHYAVALKWDRKSGRAPVCVAKGVDEIAARIRERAAEAGVPLHRDPPTARALHAGVEIGQEIRPDQYRAAAAAIRFAEAMRRRARSRRRGA
jgi:flagellar biosynthesis protein FlhB